MSKKFVLVHVLKDQINGQVNLNKSHHHYGDDKNKWLKYGYNYK